jgi:hypothetical protein
MAKDQPYIIVEGFYLLGLVDAVNQRVAQGYRPVGSVFVKADALCQPMFREAREGGPAAPSAPPVPMSRKSGGR